MISSYDRIIIRNTDHYYKLDSYDNDHVNHCSTLCGKKFKCKEGHSDNFSSGVFNHFADEKWRYYIGGKNLNKINKEYQEKHGKEIVLCEACKNILIT